MINKGYLLHTARRPIPYILPKNVLSLVRILSPRALGNVFSFFCWGCNWICSVIDLFSGKHQTVVVIIWGRSWHWLSLMGEPHSSSRLQQMHFKFFLIDDQFAILISNQIIVSNLYSHRNSTQTGLKLPEATLSLTELFCYCTFSKFWNHRSLMSHALHSPNCMSLLLLTADEKW